MATGVKKKPVCEIVVWPLTSGCKMCFKKKPSLTDRGVATGVKKPGLTDRGVATGVTKFRMASGGTDFISCSFIYIICFLWG